MPEEFDYETELESIQKTFKKRQVRIVKPHSEYPELVVHVPDSWKQIQLAPLYDVHIGSGDHDAELFAKHVKWIRDTPDVLTFNGGDAFDNATKYSPGASVVSQRISPEKQLAEVVEKFAPIQHKMLFSLPGNHEDRTFNEAGSDSAKRLANDLKLPYFPDYCLSPETRVMTAELKWVPIASLKVGQKIMGFDEHPPKEKGRGRKWRVAEVNGVKFLRKPCHRIHLSDGTSLVASSDHMWLTARSNRSDYHWEETRNLVPANRSDSHKPALIKVVKTWEEKQDYVSGYLAAAFSGEGTIKDCKGSKPWHSLGISFAQRKNDMLAKVEKFLKIRGFSFYTRPHTSPGVMNMDLGGGISEVLRFLGEIRPERLIDDFDLSHLGRMSRLEGVHVERIEDIGERDVVAIKTSTNTFFAEGFASHNCMCTIKWRGNNFRLLAHHGAGGASTAGAQLNSARKDLAWAKFDIVWTGHLHQQKVDIVYQTEYDQRGGGVHERDAVVIISPSYVKYFGSYAAKKRLQPGSRGLCAAKLQEDGNIYVEVHARGKRL